MRRLAVLASLPRWVSLPAFALGIALVRWLDLIERDALLVIGTAASFEAFYLWRSWVREKASPMPTPVAGDRVTDLGRRAIEK